ncbi:MAG: YggS family pyridoxal phosphate-dependent enzyme [Gammaproteobacteria bacterium]|nr:YggS family pyridoxal phosphate-dependent enzyme [Gammaproteobacteria bacterium]
MSTNVTALLGRIRAAEIRFGRKPGSVELLAVSKTHGVDAIAAARAAGIRAFGENYLQEALPKVAALPDLQWHFIGPVQSNKTRPIAERFAWVHTVERLKTAQRLSAQRPPELPPLNICIEVNISGESSKAGVAPSDLADLAQAVAALPGLQLRGLMALPAPEEEFAAQRAAFARLRSCLTSLNEQSLALDTLSMGTTDDFEAAIAEGATIVRIGTALFGPRQY